MIKLFRYCVFIVFFCVLQFFFGKYLNIDGIFPNFILIAVVYAGLNKGRLSAQLVGFVFGLVWDAFSTDVFGVRAIMFTLLGAFSGFLSDTFDKDQPFTQAVAVFVSSIIYWFGFSMIYFIIPEGESAYSPFAVSLYGTLKIAATVIAAPFVFAALNFIRRGVGIKLL